MKDVMRTILQNNYSDYFTIGLTSGKELTMKQLKQLPLIYKQRYPHSHQGFYGQLPISDEYPFVDESNIIFIRYDAIEYIKLDDKSLRKKINGELKK